MLVLPPRSDGRFYPIPATALSEGYGEDAESVVVVCAQVANNKTPSTSITLIFLTFDIFNLLSASDSPAEYIWHIVYARISP